ncbi:hypothetical protein [Actinomycetospora flava]|uniref:Uncharacterized protein n=1 Tax=Actinomycetospora flava TaxID=3129232 RepID=A0ABU8MEI8_9PSEU
MLARVIGTIVIILVLFAIISNPQDSAATTRNGVEALGDVGSSITVFLTSVVNSVAVSTGSTPVGTTTYYPNGGVETGDGSTPTVR